MKEGDVKASPPADKHHAKKKKKKHQPLTKSDQIDIAMPSIPVGEMRSPALQPTQDDIDGHMLVAPSARAIRDQYFAPSHLPWQTELQARVEELALPRPIPFQRAPSDPPLPPLDPSPGLGFMMTRLKPSDFGGSDTIEDEASRARTSSSVDDWAAPTVSRDELASMSLVELTESLDYYSKLERSGNYGYHDMIRALSRALNERTSGDAGSAPTLEVSRHRSPPKHHNHHGHHHHHYNHQRVAHFSSEETTNTASPSPHFSPAVHPSSVDSSDQGIARLSSSPSSPSNFFLTASQPPSRVAKPPPSSDIAQRFPWARPASSSSLPVTSPSSIDPITGYIRVAVPPGPLGLKLSQTSPLTIIDINPLASGAPNPVYKDVKPGALLRFINGVETVTLGAVEFVELLKAFVDKPRTLTFENRTESSLPFSFPKPLVSSSSSPSTWGKWAGEIVSKASEGLEKVKGVVGELLEDESDYDEEEEDARGPLPPGVQWHHLS